MMRQPPERTPAPWWRTATTQGGRSRTAGEEERMDLGIAGRKAVVCASSRGLGRGCARALALAGCDVVINGRHADTVAAAVADLQQQVAGLPADHRVEVAQPLLAVKADVDIDAVERAEGAN